MKKNKPKPLYAVFYYDRRKLRLLLAFNLCMLALLIIFGQAVFYPLIPLGLLVILLWFAATLAAAHVYFFPQKLILVTDDNIKIDRGAPLKWRNIREAEETTNRLGRQRIIVLKPVEGYNCRLTFMQRICQYSRFTAFSIPLYAMTESDQEKIREIVAAHTLFNQQPQNDRQ